MTHRTSASAEVASTPDSLFERITDLNGLPRWNEAITDVIETPSALVPGSVWKVRLHAMGRSWTGRSEARVVNPTERRFAYRSQTDDGNPSYADWEWLIVPSSIGAEVTVLVVLVPLTFGRRLLVHVRRPSLRREVRASLSALELSVSMEIPPDTSV
jgi:hypothetical protein